MVYIALGSNLGDSKALLDEAIEGLATLSTSKPIASSYWRTTPVDCPPGSPDFLNAVCALIPNPAETPESLLARLQSLEKQFGRKPKKILNESRPLDLDIIAFGRETRSTPELVIPHPRAHLRRFVLEPMCEIDPHFVLPGFQESIKQILESLPPDPCMSRMT